MKRTKTVKVLLSEALIDLMENMPYADITITDIAVAADVSRKSYNYFFRAYEKAGQNSSPAL